MVVEKHVFTQSATYSTPEIAGAMLYKSRTSAIIYMVFRGDIIAFAEDIKAPSKQHRPERLAAFVKTTALILYFLNQ